MTELSLKDRLVRFLLRNHGWIASGDLQRVVMLHTKYTPRTLVRRLQELENEKKIEVEYRTHNGTRHAFYRAKRSPILTREAALEVQSAGERLWNSLPEKVA